MPLPMPRTGARRLSARVAAFCRTLAWPGAFRLYKSNGAMARPPGRPLVEHVWRGGEWLHATTGVPFDEGAYKAGVLRRQAACERRRYWDPSTGVRERQRERNKVLAAARTLKRTRDGEQLTLDHLRPGIPIRNENLKEISNEKHDWQSTARWHPAPTEVRKLPRPSPSST